MILPAFTLPESIVRTIPQIRRWMEQAREENYVSIGVVGEAVHILPGFLESIEVSDSLLEDSVEQEGQSGSIKIIHGWNDCDLSLTLTLLDIPAVDMARYTVTPHISRYDCLREIAGWFKKMKDGTPQIYTIHHPHVAAWGAREFIFNELKSSQERSSQIITCTLDFDEYNSTTGKSQERQLGIEIIEQTPQEVSGPPVAARERAGLGVIQEKYAKL
ncbi:MAG: hypothetical protein LBK83_07645 [Treponema sp.]|jgi:hypothetical protein|nr:hypothetical protein [Treponema sp.]